MRAGRLGSHDDFDKTQSDLACRTGTDYNRYVWARLSCDWYLELFLREGRALLTEQEVNRSWRQLFKKGADLTSDAFERADGLLEELRPESPLRHRLAQELVDLRTMAGV